MRYAVDAAGDRIAAAPSVSDCRCPLCKHPVISKCGEIVAWHWAHDSLVDCDDWAEPMTRWHLNWQGVVPESQREVVMPPHRADIVTSGGYVVELQHSAISPDEIREREAFYGQRMIWVFDVGDAYQNWRLELRSNSAADGSYLTFRWKHPRKTIAVCRRPVYLDFGVDLVKLGRMYPDAPCGGFGHLVYRGRFVDWLWGESS